MGGDRASKGEESGPPGLFEEALRARDRSDQFGALIAQQGLVSVAERSKVQHLNPLVRAEREARATFAKIMGLLHLEWDHEIDGRSWPGAARIHKRGGENANAAANADRPHTRRTG